jgi:Cu2+-exporting ATPase
MALTYGDAGHGDFSAFLRPGPDHSSTLDLLVKGARCAACLAKIEGQVAGLPGVNSARLNLTTGKLTVRFGRDAGDPGAVIATMIRPRPPPPRTGRAAGCCWPWPSPASAPPMR